MEHEEAVLEISQKLKGSYEVSTRGNNLPRPLRNEAVYRPDIIARDNETKEIMYIIEVETSDKSGKSLVGSTILADYCVGVESPKKKPRLIFVFLGRNPGIHLASKRIERIAKYLKNIRKPLVFSYSDFIDTKERFSR